MKQKINLPAFPIMYNTKIGNISSENIRFRDFLLIYVKEGTGQLKVCGNTLDVSSDFVCVVAPNMEVEISTKERLSTVNVRISREAVTEFLLRTSPNDDEEETVSANDDEMMSFPHHLLLCNFIAGISGGIESNFRANEELVYLKIQECLNILAYANRNARSWLNHVNNLHKINLKDFMERHYKDNVSLEQIAEASGRSLSTFRRDFLKEFGMTPGKWLLGKRLTEAYRLITEKAMRPSEFILDLGFESFSHFSRSFKARFNIQPSALYKTISI